MVVPPSTGTLVPAQRALNTVADAGGPLGRDAQKAIASLASATTRPHPTLGSPDLARAVERKLHIQAVPLRER